MTSHLKQYSATHSVPVLACMKEFFAAQKIDAKKYSSHSLHSIEVLENFVFRGGKNIRSLLVIIGYRLAGGRGEEIFQTAAGIELMHKHILNLDDMADRDEQRYGGLTIWQEYVNEFRDQKWSTPEHHGRTMSEIDGTLLGSFAFEMVRAAHFPAEINLQVIGLMNHIMYWQTVAGWQIHYYQNHLPLAEANEAEFIKGQELVTAQYTFVAPLLIGLTCAGKSADPTFVQPLTEFGRAVGTAFQMQDDILGLFGDSAQTGKPVGNDIREGKKTILLQRAYKAANPADKKFLEDVCGRDLQTGELERVQKIVQDTGALQQAQQLAKEAIKSGLKELEKLPNSAAQEELQTLKDLALYVIERSV
jgi:geranylgeranyl diphosphate synthase type I